MQTIFCSSYDVEMFVAFIKLLKTVDCTPSIVSHVLWWHNQIILELILLITDHVIPLYWGVVYCCYHSIINTNKGRDPCGKQNGGY